MKEGKGEILIYETLEGGPQIEVKLEVSRPLITWTVF
jgi:hypothetical protein